MKILKIAVCFFLLYSTAFAQTKKPNIIFILADDLGIDGVSSYGADLFKTPIIDGRFFMDSSNSFSNLF